jgi:hypothetical protein
VSPPPVYALRVCPRAAADRWWASARLAVHLAPPAVRAILTGRSRVEVSAQEAREALEWARGIDGWEADGTAPLYVVRGGDDYPEDGREAEAPPLPSGT